MACKFTFFDRLVGQSRAISFELMWTPVNDELRLVQVGTQSGKDS
jgi:hypothetical protein